MDLIEQEKLSALLVCSICLAKFTDPIVLPCRHVFCRECHLKLIKEDIIKCANCRKRYKVPDQGFPSDILVNSLLSIRVRETKSGSISKKSDKVSRVEPARNNSIVSELIDLEPEGEVILEIRALEEIATRQSPNHSTNRSNSNIYCENFCRNNLPMRYPFLILIYGCIIGISLLIILVKIVVVK